jgi:hypothetical protein
MQFLLIRHSPMNFIFVFFGILSGFACLSAQTKEGSPQEGIRIDATKPVAYVEFERFRKDTPLFNGDSVDRVYLKLVNNSKWSVYIDAFVYGKNEEKQGLYFTVEREDKRVRVGKLYSDEIPKGYVRGDCGSGLTELESGKSYSFSVPRNHLAKNLKIRIQLYFDWMGTTEQPYLLPEMSVFFSSSGLDKLLAQKKTIP